MTIGNKPRSTEVAVVGKRYWWLSIGRDAMPYRYTTDGWHAFEFVILKKYAELKDGEAHPHSFRLAFVFWIPFALMP